LRKIAKRCTKLEVLLVGGTQAPETLVRMLLLHNRVLRILVRDRDQRATRRATRLTTGASIQDVSFCRHVTIKSLAVLVARFWWLQKLVMWGITISQATCKELLNSIGTRPVVVEWLPSVSSSAVSSSSAM